MEVELLDNESIHIWNGKTNETKLKNTAQRFQTRVSRDFGPDIATHKHHPTLPTSPLVDQDGLSLNSLGTEEVLTPH